MSMLPLTGVQVVSYNGVVFDASAKVKITAKPVLDDARRVMKYIEFTIDVRGYVTNTPGSTTDGSLLAMRNKLTAVGKTLKITGKGYGDLVVNNPGSAVRDANWGPIPQVLTWIPLGDVQSCLVEWQVVTCVPHCTDTTPRYTFGLMAFGFTVDYQLDSDGYTTVKTAGYLEIPMTRSASKANTAPDTADAYRDRVVPAPILGFQRSMDFQISKNHSRLDFTITDVELPVALPDFATKCEVDHTVKGIGGQPVWNCTISGTIRMANGRPRSSTFDTFKRIYMDRIAQPPAGPGVFAVPGFAARRRPFVRIREIQITEAIFGKDARFSVNYVIYNTSLEDIIQVAGLWKPLFAPTHGRWQASMNVAKVLGARSVAGLGLKASDDILIDLCDGTPPKPPRNTNNAIGKVAPTSATSSTGQQIPPDASWIDYRTRIELSQTRHVARHARLDDSTIQRLPPGDSATDLSFQLNQQTPPGSDASDRYGDILQAVETPDVHLRLIGSALRVQWPINPPQLLRIGVVACEEVDRQIATSVVDSYGGVPINACTWSLTYRLNKPIQRIPVLANPQLNSQGTPGN